jgi:DNA replication protein DnaC
VNPISESKANRDGIIHVISKMKWYSSLSKLLLEETFERDKRFAELRDQLANRILVLYKTLLKYVFKSICAYDRNPALGILRDLVKLDDWNGSLEELNIAEGCVKEAAGDYGVRQANSYLKLIFNMHLSTAQNEIMQMLFVTDMTAEIESLQNRKDHLLLDSYKWILDNKDYQDFTDWHHDNTKRLLWIKGDAGKGKTMLLIGIIRELTAQLDTYFDKPYLSYFFCQGTDENLNTATAVLRGLIWMLLRQEKSLIRHLVMFKDFGSKLFEDRNAFYNLKKIFQNMLNDGVLRRAYLVVDALDECRNEEPGLSQLLQLISEVLETHHNVKWLVSSRNVTHIETSLDENNTRTRLSLELNHESMASAVEAYINCKMSGLAERYRKDYAARKDPGIHEKLRIVQDDVAKELRQKADGTFLWVALVFKQIEGCGADTVLELVRKIPSGLGEIYDQMMRQINKLNDGYSRHCKRVLLIAVNTYRPLRLSELVTLAELPELAAHHNIVRLCGLLTIGEDDNVVYFVHQSAKDYLIEHAESEISPRWHDEGHCMVVSRSLQAMSTTLRRDIYDLQDPGCLIEQVYAKRETSPSGRGEEHRMTVSRSLQVTSNTLQKDFEQVESVDSDPLAHIRYSCLHWINHLCEIPSSLYDKVGLCDGETIHMFLQEHFLHWLEALSLLRSMPNGVLAIAKLENLLRVSFPLI